MYNIIMAYFKRKKPAYKSKKTAFKKKSGYKSKKPNLKSMIKKEISRQAENKSSELYVASQNIYNKSSASFTASVFPISPFTGGLQIDQGVSASQRIGNKIKIKSLIFDATVFPTLYNATTNPAPQPYQVKFWFYYDKLNPTSLSPPDTSFLQLGGSNLALQGNLIDLSAPVNKDRWRVLATRTVKIGYASNSGTGVSVVSQSFTNNDFKLNQRFRIDLTNHVIKNVVYNDNNTVPTTRALYCIAECVNSASNAVGAAYIPIEMAYTLCLQYEDM